MRLNTYEIDLEITKTKLKIKELKKLKKLVKKDNRLSKLVFKPHPYFAFQELMFAFIDLIKSCNDR